MREPTFLLLHPQFELEQLRTALASPLEEAGLTDAVLRQLELPFALREEGWSASAVLSTVSEPSDLSARLAPLAACTASSVHRRVAGICLVEANPELTQAVLGDALAPPRSLEGQAESVLREVAAWLEVDVEALARFFGGAPPALQPHSNALLALPQPALFGSGGGSEDEEHLVQSHLRKAEEWMARYRAALKQP